MGVPMDSVIAASARDKGVEIAMEISRRRAKS